MAAQTDAKGIHWRLVVNLCNPGNIDHTNNLKEQIEFYEICFYNVNLDEHCL